MLRDGRTCHLRPIRPDDNARLATFHSRLSAETIYFRFFAPYPELSERDLARFTTVDHRDRVALVATEGGELIAVARYDRINPRDAEVAFVVRDDHQSRGLGAVMLEHLAAAAWEVGLRRFVAEVLPNNRRMMATFREAGYVVSQRMDDGVFHLTFDLEQTDEVLSVRAAREQRSEAISVERLLNPVGVAVIGASRTPGRVGHELLRHLRDYGSHGPLYAIHPEADSILRVPAYPKITDIPQPVDLAVVAVPAESVLEVVDQCAAAGVIGLIVVSAGFADTATDAGRARQRKLVRTARESGMRVVGPNCLGVINTDPRISLNASLSPLVPGRGRVGLFCQSGALGVTVLETVARRGLGLSSFISAGNRADVSANDLLQYWESDPSTSLILLYLESIGNPRKFTRISRRLSRSKPVVAVRSGRYSQTLPLGHQVRRSTLPTGAVDAVFEQSGVIQTSSLNELFDVGAVLAYQPLPRGDRVAVLGTSQALEILAADAVESSRMTVAYGQPSLAQSASAEEIGAALRSATEHAGCDSVVFVHIPSVGTDQTDVHEAITAASVDSTKPVIAVMPAADGTGLLPAGMGLLAVVGADRRPEHGSVPTFSNVEDAVHALALVRGYARWRDAEEIDVPEFSDVDPERALALITRWLDESQADTTVAMAEIESEYPGHTGDHRARGRPVRGPGGRAAGLLRDRGCGPRRGSAPRRRPWPPLRSSASPWSSRRRLRGWRTGRTWAACGSTSSRRAACARRTCRWWPSSTRWPVSGWSCSRWPPRGWRPSSARSTIRCSGPVVHFGVGEWPRSCSATSPTGSRRSAWPRHAGWSPHPRPRPCCAATREPIRWTPRRCAASSPGSACWSTRCPRWPPWTSIRSWSPAPARRSSARPDGSGCTPRGWTWVCAGCSMRERRGRIPR